MPRKRFVTPQRENFARHVVMGYDGASAYRIAYQVKPETKPQTIWAEAYRLMKDPLVAARIAELKAEAAQLAVIDRASMLTEMAVNRTVALGIGKVSVAETASFHRARVAGLLQHERPSTNVIVDASTQVKNELSVEQRSLNDLARKIAFALAKGKRESTKLIASTKSAISSTPRESSETA